MELSGLLNLETGGHSQHHLRKLTCPELGSEMQPSSHNFSAFIKDCSYRTPDVFMPDCQRLRDLFTSKEVLGKAIRNCGTPPPYPNPRIPKRVPARREEYIHDSQTDLWYHCCEYRPPFGDFSAQADAPRMKAGKLSRFMPELLRGFASSKSNGIPDIIEEPKGPLLQCNIMENLKHRQDDDGGRMATDGVAKGTLQALVGSSAGNCRGDQAVALQPFAGGIKRRIIADDTGTCIDIGPPGCATPMGKPYHVFQLGAPVPPLMDAAVAFAILAAGCHPNGRKARTGGTLRAMDFF